MGLLDKITSRTARKTTDRIADKVSSGIVDKLFGKSSPDDTNRTITVNAPSVNVDRDSMNILTDRMTEASQEMMGMAYNTKRCPNCKSICINSPVTCKYCQADLRDVEPLTPEELEKLNM